MNRSLEFVVGCLIALVVVSSDCLADEPVGQWRAAAASVKITPQSPLPMAGYAGRKEPAEGTEQDLFGKALAIEDHEGNRLVMITLDLIGVSTELRSVVADQLLAKHKLPSHSLLMNASHTHCGPAYTNEESTAYRKELESKLVDVASRALDNLQPAKLSYSLARCSVAMNRRTPTATGYKNHPNPYGPVDHAVPVLRVDDAEGKLHAVVFGYACHNTTMGFRKWLGDYAGYAQEYFEADHPGVTALFMMGCGGDQNPYPRSELKYAQMHGRSLATSVEAALEQNQTKPLHQSTLTGALRTRLETVELDFTTEDRPSFAYPVQVVELGTQVTLVALGSEVVVDYSLRLKDELSRPGGPAIWIAGYSNAYAGYIPSRRVLVEGGYEAESRPWKLEIEERIIGKVHELVGGRE